MSDNTQYPDYEQSFLLESNRPSTPNVDDFMRYEPDQMSHEEEVAFMQRLINNGMAWSLQGHYGRTAQHFISMGLCTRPPDVEPLVE